MSPETILDPVVSDSSKAGDSPAKGFTDFTSLREKVFGKRNTPSKRKPSSPKENPEELPGVTEKELAEIFAGENWEELSAMYFNARFAITGYDGFLLSPGQKITLGLSLAKTMKMLLKIDPGYIALVVFTTNFAGLIGAKELQYHHMKKKQTVK